MTLRIRIGFATAFSLVLAGCGGGGSSTGVAVTQWTPLVLQETATSDTTLLDINTSGLAVGTSGARLTTWTAAGGFHRFGTLGGPTSKGAAVGETGIVVGASDTAAGSSAVQTNGFGLLALNVGTVGNISTEAHGVNSAGDIVGIKFQTGVSCDVFRLNASGSVDDFAGLGGVTNLTITSVSSNGNFCGYGANAAGKTVGFYSSGTSLITVDIAGFNSTRLTAVSDNGMIYGYKVNASGIAFSFKLAAGSAPTDIALPTGATSMKVLGVNSRNELIGTATFSGVDKAILVRGTSTIDLSASLLTALPAGTSITAPVKLLTDGTILCTGTDGAHAVSILLQP